MIIIKRIYEPISKNDGFRVLVDRLWPRGISKEKAHLNLCCKEIVPSNKLGKWFGHDLKKQITLLFGAKDREHNQAVVLKKLLES